MMLPMMDRKKMLASVLKKEPKDVPTGVESDFSPAMEANAGDLLSAIESKDKSKIVSAFKNMMALCSQEDEYSEPEEE